MELLRSWGLEPQVRDAALDVEWRALATPTLAGAATGQPIEVGYPSADQSAVVSPTAPACVPQDELERILEEHLGHAPHGAFGARRRDRDASRAAPTACTVARRAAARTIRARYLVAADGIRSTRAGRRSASRRPTPAPLAERLTVLLRGPLWELVGERRHVIYFLDGEVAAVPMGRPTAGCSRSRRPGPATSARGAPAGRAGARRWTLDVEHVSRTTVRGRAGRALPRAQRVPDRRRRPPAHPARRDRDEHRDPRRLRPRLEARVGAARLGRRGAARQLRGRAPPGGRAQRRPRSADPNGSDARRRREELHVDLGGRIAHAWLPGETGRVSTLDLLGDGLTLFTGARRGAGPPRRGHAARHRPPARRHHRSRARDPQRRRAAGAARRGAR